MVASISGFFTQLTDYLDEWSAEWWFLAAIFAVALLDSVIPAVPSETTVIVGGVAVATGSAPYSLWMVIVAAALGAFLGDNLAYTIGRWFSPAFERRADRKPKFARRLHWARDQLRVRGGPLLISARFLPGGRSVLTLSSGITRQPRGWFAKWVAIAAVIWATYAAGLAYLVGQPFEDDHTKAFWVAFATAIGMTVLIEVVRWLRERAGRRKEVVV